MQSAVVRKFVALSLLWVTPLGFLFKRYSGPAHRWFNDYGAGLLYEVFWILVVFFLIPRKSVVRTIPVWVFVVTSFLEVVQLWHPPILQKIRSNFWGSTLIGTTFVWWDFFYYALGCGLGWLLIKKIADLAGEPEHPHPA